MVLQMELHAAVGILAGRLILGQSLPGQQVFHHGDIGGDVQGLLTEQGSSTFWDRSTLYALRGIYIAGQADRATEFLSHYARRRLLGDHVPYPIEAWPEGSQRHLAAESGLFCRVITEGLFGIRPTGFRSFDLTPSMPSGWNRMALRHIRAFENNFDLVIEKQPDGFLRVTLAISGRNPRAFRLRQGASLRIKLP